MTALRSLLVWLSGLPSGALATVVGALIALVSALVVALVNARASRNAAYRTFRADQVKPLSTYATGIAQAVGAALVMWPAADWIYVKHSVVTLVTTDFLRHGQEAKSMFTTGQQVEWAMRLLLTTMNDFSLFATALSEKGFSPAHREVLEAHGHTMQGAAADVLVATEAYVFGGVWLRCSATYKHLAVLRSRRALAKKQRQLLLHDFVQSMGPTVT